jgi:hypothetical protein
MREQRSCARRGRSRVSVCRVAKPHRLLDEADVERFDLDGLIERFVELDLRALLRALQLAGYDRPRCRDTR